MTRRNPLPIKGARSVMAPPRCPTCGHPKPDVNALPLNPTQKRIMALLDRHGEIHPDVLYDALYASDPNGGPSPVTLRVHIHQLNKRLKPYGMEVRRWRKVDDPWRLVQIMEAAE